MPEMRFHVRWPDGTEESCYSPSLVVKDHLTPGISYPVAEFVAVSREALTIASERVKARYGVPCGLALDQLRRIEARGREFATEADAAVTVLCFRE